MVPGLGPSQLPERRGHAGERCRLAVRVRVRARPPWVIGLEVLPLYDAIARVKVQAHWQTDVLAGFAIGTAAGYYAHSRDSPFILQALPHGIAVGIRKQW